MKITLSHGSGGKATAQLIDSIFATAFSNPVLNMMEDSAVVDGNSKIAVTTDSFVVTPLIFKGGDIGRLAVCGTVNDLLMRGATPKYITSAFIIEEGADTDTLKQIARSMADTAAEGFKIVDKRLPFAPDRNGIDTKLEVRVYNLFHHALCGREVMDKIAFGRL